MSDDIILVKRAIAGPAASVWALVQDQGCLKSEVDDIRGIEVLSEDRAERVVSWCVWLKGFELRWVEAQKVDSQRRRLDFQQTQGMFAEYRGFWQVVSTSSGTVAELHLNVDTGIPYLSGFVNPVIAKAFNALAIELLSGLDRLSLADSLK